MVAIRKKTLLWIVIAVLFLATIFLTFKANSIASASAIQSTGSAVRTAASTASAGMVGGC